MQVSLVNTTDGLPTKNKMEYLLIQSLGFPGVHDSYWTHACDVDTMNRILREKFVELYNTPILEDVSIQ